MNARSLHVQDVGAGRPVVLVAGFGLSHPVWDRQVRVLADAGYRAVCIDLPGTGGSPKPADGYDVDTLAGDVANVLETMDLRDVTLVGWSFGGQVAFHLTADCDRVRDLVLLTSNGVRASRSEAFPFGPPGDKLEAQLVAGEHADRLAARRATLTSGFAAPPSDDVLDFLLRVQLEMPSWAAVASYHAYLQTDLTDDLPKITVPVLQIMGERDPVMPLDGAAWLQERLADARLVVLEGCGHYPMFEAPDELDDALLSFLRRT
ncbi:MAG TPA: alpha/beta hydrolase [Solirubrobacteraceae bacterium]